MTSLSSTSPPSAIPNSLATDPEKASPNRGHPPLSDSLLRSSEPSSFLHSLVLLIRLETRGIQRVTPSESTVILSWHTYMQPFVLWVSINLAAVNITLGMLAPTVFGLGFMDAALCATGGSAIGSAAVAYIATWGPKSGCRTMVSSSSCSPALWILAICAKQLICRRGRR